MPEYRDESSMPLRVSFVNLQKLTFQAWLERPSMKMFAPEQKMRSLALVMMTERTCGCSKRMRLSASCSSMSTPRAEVLSWSWYPGRMPPSSAMASDRRATGASTASFQWRYCPGSVRESMRAATGGEGSVMGSPQSHRTGVDGMNNNAQIFLRACIMLHVKQQVNSSRSIAAGQSLLLPMPMALRTPDTSACRL